MRVIPHPNRGRRMMLTIPFLTIIILLMGGLLPANAQQSVIQSTKGNQSPPVYAPGGQLTIIYKNYYISEATGKKVEEKQRGNKKIIESLLKTLVEKDVALADRDAKFEDLSRKYKELEVSLARRPANDTIAAQARKRLEKGDQKGAEKLLQQSFKNNLQDSKQKRKAAAADAYELGSLRELQLDYQGAKIYYEQAVAFDPENSKYLNYMGRVLSALANYNNAIDYYTKALDIDLKAENHEDVAKDYHGLGSVWEELGDFKKAMDYFTKAINIDLKAHGENHEDVARAYNGLGSVWEQLGDLKKAMDYFTKAINIYLMLHDDKHLSDTYNNLGIVWWRLGDSKKAIDYLTKSLDIELKIYDWNHPFVAGTYGNLGIMWGSLGEHKKAIDHYTKTLNIDLKVYGNNHPDVARAYINLCGEWRELGEPAKAIDYCSKALDIFIVVYPADHPLTKMAKTSLEYAKKEAQSKTITHPTDSR